MLNNLYENMETGAHFPVGPGKKIFERCLAFPNGKLWQAPKTGKLHSNLSLPQFLWNSGTQLALSICSEQEKHIHANPICSMYGIIANICPNKITQMKVNIPAPWST